MSTVVLIESDWAMRTLLSEWLVAAGHRVQEWTAVERGHRCDASVVIVDLPNLRSQAEKTVRELHKRCARSTIIGMSAQLARSLAADSGVVVALGLGSLIAKPCTRDELLAAVRGALGPNG